MRVGTFVRFFVYKIFLLFVYFLFVISGKVSSEQNINRLNSLSYTNPQLKKLRKEIAANLKATARGQGLSVPLRIIEYRVRKQENFYSIMARLSQDADSLSSLNDLPNPNALRAGQIIRIPNARGVFKVESDFTKEERRNKKDFTHRVDGFYFFPGEKMPREQYRMFRGEGFYPPLGKQKGRISSGFGVRKDPFRNKRTFHGGLDIAARRGTDVFASRSGRVVRAQKNVKGYGNLVVISHGYGYQTWYGHLHTLNVKKGQKIRLGQKLGSVGSTGRATGPHLHFEIRKNGHKKNPESMIHR